MPGTGHSTMLSAEVATELRDALRRRQKELPPRWLAAVDAAALADGAALPGHPRVATERQLAMALLERHLTDARPRGIVCIQPSASGASVAVVGAITERAGSSAVVAAELDFALASEMTGLLTLARGDVRAVPLASDCTVELPLPESFPRPRVYLALGNVLGATTTVGAVRLLRILRTTMSPGDRMLVGLDVRRETIDDESDAFRTAARHFDALRMIGEATGAEPDPGLFEYRVTYDTGNHRAETHLVARRGLVLELPGIGDVRFRKGESLRTSVRCMFDRARVSAMMAGVGLALLEWTTDPAESYVVALATTAV